MKLTVLLKFFKGDLNPFDASALECALELGDEVTVVAMAPPSALPALEGLTRLGVRAILLSDALYAGSDTLATSYVLSEALRRIEPDAVFAGRQSVDGDTGQVPPMLAERLGWGLVRSVMKQEGRVLTTRTGESFAVEKGNIYTFEKFACLRFPSIFSRAGKVEIWDNSVLSLCRDLVGQRGSPTKVVRSYESTVGKRSCRIIAPEELPFVIERSAKKRRSRDRELIPEDERIPLVYYLGDIGEELEPFAADTVRLGIPSSSAELSSTVESFGSAVVLFEDSPELAELAARCAVTVGAGICADCISFRYEEDRVILTRPALGGNVTADIECKERFTFATVRTARGGSSPLVIGVGRGAVERKEKLREIAALMGAELAATRSVVDSGEMPYSAQVGLTGRVIAPDVYLAIGISGAVQHTCAIAESGTVIAVNNDKNARIFDYADYGVVADTETIERILRKHYAG